MQIQEILKLARSRLQHSDTAVLDAEILLAHVLNKSREYLLGWPETELSASQERDFQQVLQRRVEGQPIAYLTGRKAFWDFELSISPEVLIPRPETELLVELALDLLPEQTVQLADLGTGSGAIALALGRERPQWEITATDSSAPALEVARRNALTLQVQNINFELSDWCAAISARLFDAIVSNPPYIAQDDAHLTQGDLRFEPAAALVADDQGLADIQVIIRQARQVLVPDGLIMLEHGFQQGAAVRHLLQQSGYNAIQTRKDLAGLDRVSLARK